MLLVETAIITESPRLVSPRGRVARALCPQLAVFGVIIYFYDSRGCPHPNPPPEGEGTLAHPLRS